MNNTLPKATLGCGHMVQARYAADGRTYEWNCPCGQPDMPHQEAIERVGYILDIFMPHRGNR